MSEHSAEKDASPTRDEVAALVHAIWPERGCPTPGCTGDPRYAAPGRRHITGCEYPATLPDLTRVTPPEVRDQ